MTSSMKTGVLTSAFSLTENFTSTPIVTWAAYEFATGRNRSCRQVYRAGAANIANYPAADVTVERIGDLVDYDLSTLLGKAGSKS